MLSQQTMVPPIKEIHDIKDLVSVEVPMSFGQMVLLAILVTLCIVLLVTLWVYVRRRHLKVISVEETIIPPDEKALQGLKDLAREIGISGRAFYFRLSLIFRGYVKGRYGIDALEMTADELLPRIEGLGIHNDLKRSAKGFIISGDLIKYAGNPVERTQMDADFAFVQLFIEKTSREKNV